MSNESASPINWRDSEAVQAIRDEQACDIRPTMGGHSTPIWMFTQETLNALCDAVAALHSRSQEKPSEKAVAWVRERLYEIERTLHAFAQEGSRTQRDADSVLAPVLIAERDALTALIGHPSAPSSPNV